MLLDLEHYKKRTYHNEKVVKWFVESQFDYNLPQTVHGLHDVVCDNCTITEDVEYIAFDERMYCVDIVEKVPGLTYEEKEELEDMAIIRIRVCSHCKEWGLEGLFN
ncbi:hypothetical protein BCJMU51_p303 (plasmid) [Bacillus cereus]|uniref:hypothetical protein n=1 Tax=Bacillus cereus group TaxID=86661 RepID=UPI001BB2F91E|nr:MULTISPECIES: hypothetical protein [Bacillus cereus group]BCC44672.1 hypothetical protein BCJMU01_p324 [Bacillus cereus]BCC74249.1 hypothetical protein BCJMU51_p303 [Bacillus cereus]BCD33056.1 hypothetical protein BC30102_p725 [Bacillus cereus]